MNPPPDIPAQKRALRASVLARRRAVAGRGAASRIIADRVARMPEFQNAAVLAAFAPMPDEADIKPLLQAALQAGKILLLPRVADLANGQMDFHQVPNLNQLLPSHPSLPSGSSGSSGPALPSNPSGPVHSTRPGKIQISEPDPGRHPRRDPAAADFFLVPAVAADPENFRLGYGGGFYDRLLAKLPPAAPTCCPIFSVQIAKKIPREVHDRPIWRIITEAA